MADLDNPIVFERVIDATLDEAFALFTEPERLRRWQAASVSVDLRVGGDYRFTVVPGSIAYGTYAEIEPGKRLRYSWDWEGRELPATNESMISVEFEPMGDQTKVTMTHSGLDEESAASHSEGWTYFMDRLAVAATDGDAGRNSWGLEADEYDLVSLAEATWVVCRDVVAKCGPESLSNATPCEGFDVQDLTNHLLDSLDSLGGTAGATLPERTPDLPIESSLANAVAPTLAAWRARGAEGMVPFGEDEAPAAMLAGILSLEFLLHAWDYAQATGQSLQVPAGIVEAVQGLAESTIRPEFRGEGKGFAQATEPSSSDPLTALAAYTGRQT